MLDRELQQVLQEVHMFTRLSAVSGQSSGNRWCGMVEPLDGWGHRAYKSHQTRLKRKLESLNR